MTAAARGRYTVSVTRDAPAASELLRADERTRRILDAAVQLAEAGGFAAVRLTLLQGSPRQITRSLLDREVEERILPLARERGIAVIANRPFREGALLRGLERHRLPPWVIELGCDGWAQFALKFIVSHPAVTCAIPATSSVAHVRQNMAAATGSLPDASMRQRMASHVAAL